MWRMRKFSIMPTVRKNPSLLRNILRVGIPKSTVLRIIFRVFYVAALIEECGTKKHYPLAKFRDGISKNTRSSYKGTMNDGTPLSSSDSEMASKVKKNRH